MIYLTEKQILKKVIFLCRIMQQEANGLKPSNKIMKKFLREIKALKAAIKEEK